MNIGESQNPADVTAPVSGDTTAPETENPGTSEEQEQEEPRLFTQEEVDAIAAKTRAQERRRAEREIAQREQQPRTPSAEPPKPDDYKTAAEYLDALGDWKADHRIAAREQQKQQNEVKATYAEREEGARNKYPDFEEVAYSDHVPITKAMAATIMESEHGPEMAYWLGKNLKAAERIAGLSPLAQAKELGKIEATLAPKTATVKQSTSAPAPIAPVGARSTPATYSTSDPRSTKTMSTSEWIEARNREIAAKNK